MGIDAIESNMWITDYREKKYAHNVDVGRNESIDQLATANNICWSCVEERGWSYLEKCIRL